jgi:hypothetical protein
MLPFWKQVAKTAVGGFPARSLFSRAREPHADSEEEMPVFNDASLTDSKAPALLSTPTIYAQLKPGIDTSSGSCSNAYLAAENPYKDDWNRIPFLTRHLRVKAARVLL